MSATEKVGSCSYTQCLHDLIGEEFELIPYLLQ